MKVFRFSNKQQTKTYTIFTLISVVLAILIFSSLDIYINKQIAYLLVTILSSISILYAIRKANKGIEEIIIEDDKVKFYFLNKTKDQISVSRIEITATINKDSIEFKNSSSDKLIGQAYKNRIEQVEQWPKLVEYFQ